MSAAVTMPEDVARGTFAGRWYEASCAECGCMLALRNPPPRGEAPKCAGCRAESEAAQVVQTARDLIAERDAWRARARKAEADLEAACDTIHELQGIVNRAYTGES